MGDIDFDIGRLKKEYLDSNCFVLDNFLSNALHQSALTSIFEIEKINILENDFYPWVLTFHDRLKEYIVGSRTPVPKKVYEIIRNSYEADLNSTYSIYYWYKFLKFRDYIDNSSINNNSTLYLENVKGISAKNFNTFTKILDEFKRPIFLNLLSNVTGITLGTAFQSSFSLTKFDYGAFISPHTDDTPESKYKLAIILYLNEKWKSEWGGVLNMKVGASWKEIEPVGNRLVVFQPSADSIHFVSKVLEKENCRYAISGWILK